MQYRATAYEKFLRYSLVQTICDQFCISRSIGFRFLFLIRYTRREVIAKEENQNWS